MKKITAEKIIDMINWTDFHKKMVLEPAGTDIYVDLERGKLITLDYSTTPHPDDGLFFLGRSIGIGNVDSTVYSAGWTTDDIDAEGSKTGRYVVTLDVTDALPIGSIIDENSMITQSIENGDWRRPEDMWPNVFYSIFDTVQEKGEKS
jgi:hypothetical protein